jgi:hypothetical protein
VTTYAGVVAQNPEFTPVSSPNRVYLAGTGDSHSPGGHAFRKSSGLLRGREPTLGKISTRFPNPEDLMKRLLTFALAATALVAGTGSELQAQEMTNRRASRFDLGVYAGGAYTTAWYESRTASVTDGVLTEEDDGEGFGFG